MFLGPTDFTDFTGDLRWVSLVAKDFCPTLDTLNLQLVTFEMIDSKIFEDPNSLGWLQGQEKTLSLDTIDFIFFKTYLFFTTGAAFLPDIGYPRLGHHHFIIFLTTSETYYTYLSLYIYNMILYIF